MREKKERGGEMREKDKQEKIEDWRVVTRKTWKPKENCWDLKIGKGNIEGEEVTSYYFSEFPEDYGAKDMFDIFTYFGLMDEVIIPPRRDKRGRRYGFVRYRKVRDERMLEVELDNICIRDKKIHANVPKF